MGAAALSGKAQNVEKREARLMTVRDAALYLAVPAATLYSRVWKKEIPFVVICGPDEIKKNEVTVKSMESGKQKTIPQNQIITYLKGYTQ